MRLTFVHLLTEQQHSLHLPKLNSVYSEKHWAERHYERAMDEHYIFLCVPSDPEPIYEQCYPSWRKVRLNTSNIQTFLARQCILQYHSWYRAVYVIYHLSVWGITIAIYSSLYFIFLPQWDKWGASCWPRHIPDTHDSLPWCTVY